MAIGMSYREFWYDDPFLVAYYKKSYDFKRKEENQKMWINGIYTLKALEVALSGFGKKKEKYYEKPLDIFPKTEAEKKEEILRERQKIVEHFTMLKQRWDNKYGNSR